MEKLYTSKTFLKMAVGGCVPLILPPGHKLQKPLKEFGIFYSLDTRAGAKGARGPAPPQSTCLTPPINKLLLLKTAAFVLNFKLWPPLISVWPHLSRLLWRRLCLAPIILFFFTKRQSQKGGPWHNAPLNTLLSLR